MNTILKLHGIDHRLKMFKKNWNRMKTILKLRKLYVKKVRKMLQLQLSLLARLSLRLALLCLPRCIFPVVALSRHGGHDPPRRPRFPIREMIREIFFIFFCFSFFSFSFHFVFILFSSVSDIRILSRSCSIHT